jgi:hypothetical protein
MAKNNGCQKLKIQEFVESLLPQQRNYLFDLLKCYRPRKWNDLKRLKNHLLLAKKELFPYENINRRFKSDGTFETWSVLSLLDGWYDVLQKVLRENEDKPFKNDLGFFIVRHLKFILEKYESENEIKIFNCIRNCQ